MRKGLAPCRQRISPTNYWLVYASLQLWWFAGRFIHWVDDGSERYGRFFKDSYYCDSRWRLYANGEAPGCYRVQRVRSTCSISAKDFSIFCLYFLTWECSFMTRFRAVSTPGTQKRFINSVISYTHGAEKQNGLRERNIHPQTDEFITIRRDTGAVKVIQSIQDSI